MNCKSGYFILFVSLFSISLMSCGSGGKENKTAETVQTPAPLIGQETSLLLRDLEENGDYVNSQYFPSLIKASVVLEELEKNNLIIDLRTPESFRKGHIRGAVSKTFNELPEYFETGIRPFEYDRIIMVCDDGQLSSYTTALLRMMGYGNVFALRWGMGGWNRSYAQEGWMNGVSGKYEGLLETVTTEAPKPAGMPELTTGMTAGKEISDVRFGKLFEEGTGEILITVDEIFSDPDKYFVVNLERKDKYDNGHIPGAVRYKPESTLGFPEVMATIPKDKTVVVYCGTGHNSAFATAFLRLFGYDARTLRYGNNSFMYDKMIKDRTALSWLPFTLAESNDYTVVK